MSLKSKQNEKVLIIEAWYSEREQEIIMRPTSEVVMFVT